MALTLVVAGVVVPKPQQASAATKISSAKDLLAMEENPSGDYVLTKDITVPENTSLFTETPFMGTLDGKGHKLKGYKSTTSTGIFANAKYAIFKNLSVTGVDIKADGSAAALVGNSDNCEFNNVSVSGKIVAGGDGGSVGAIVASGNGSLEKCKNSAKITAKTKKAGKSVGGLAGDFKATVLKNCSNSGAVTLTTGKDAYVFFYASTSEDPDDSPNFVVTGLVAGEADKVVSCKNSGSVTANMNFKIDKSKDASYGAGVRLYVAGICNSVPGPISSSGNTGKIKVNSAKSAEVLEVYMGGVAAQAGRGTLNKDKIVMTKCYNTGEVSYSGVLKGGFGSDGDAWFLVGGVFGTSRAISQCYNKGKVSVTFLSGSTGASSIGGVAGEVGGSINHCYNTGSVTVTNKGKKTDVGSQLGGIAGFANDVVS